MKKVAIPARYAVLIAFAHLAQGAVMLLTFGRYYLSFVEGAVFWAAKRVSIKESAHEL